MAEEQEQKHGAGEDSQGDQDKASGLCLFVGDISEDDIAGPILSLRGQIPERVFLVIPVGKQRAVIPLFPVLCRVKDL